MTDNILKKLGFSSRGATQSRPLPQPLVPQPPVPQLVVLQPPTTGLRPPIGANPYSRATPLIQRPLGIPPLPYYGAPAELDGSHISRQLIVGVDFVSSFAAGTLKNIADQRHQGTTFSSVAFALVTDQGVTEEIITEWPGAGNRIILKV